MKSNLRSVCGPANPQAWDECGPLPLLSILLLWSSSQYSKGSAVDGSTTGTDSCDKGQRKPASATNGFAILWIMCENTTRLSFHASSIRKTKRALCSGDA